MSGAQSRLAAADLLIRCLDERRTLEDAMAGSPAYKALQGSDRGFARAMASAALRQLGRIDAGLTPFLDRPLDSATPPARALLRVGAAQAWVLAIADHAVVSSTVDAAKAWPRARRAAGLLNAVLRKVVADRSAFDAAPLEAIWPDWLWQQAKAQLGEGAARDLVLAQTEQAPLHLSVREPQSVSDWAARLGADIVSGATLQLNPTDVIDIEGYKGGAWWVQDVAAALPARLLQPVGGEYILDLCAAPGGKTLQLANTGAKVTAVDRSRQRLRRLRENLKRVPTSKPVGVVEADICTWTPDRPADRILLDAPCSALGTLRRHPEGVWIKSQEDVSRYPALQLRLLKAAMKMLKPGGTLVYCVCSPFSDEGLDVVEQAIANGLAQRLAIVSGEVAGFEACLTEAGDLLTLPQSKIQHDAFYISRLARPH